MTQDDLKNGARAGSDVSSDESDWDDAEPEEEEAQSFISLLDDTVFPDVDAMLRHCRTKHNFDFLAIRRRLGLDFFGTVKLVNYIRQHIHDGSALPETISVDDIADERYMKPVIEDDALIMALTELDLDDETSGQLQQAPQGGASREAQLEEELAQLQSQFAKYRNAVEQTLDQRWGEDTPVPTQGEKPRDPDDKGVRKDESQYYWESYASNDIHETMLKDKVRTDSYRDFVYNNKSLFKDKIVLDIGCGTGILSMFCAKAGAKQVFAVDKSDIIDKARENVFNNGLTEKVTCIRGRVEDISLPVDQVDIIISEWMGYCLLYEAMMNSVLVARDRFLKPDGLIAPSISTIWVAPVSDPEYITDFVTFWDDVYGFDMKSMKEGIYDEARIEIMPEDCICGTPSQISYIDLHTVKIEDLDFETQWKSKVTKDIPSLDGFLTWFDIFFTTSRNDSIPADLPVKAGETIVTRPGEVAFTTGPAGPDTHWKQGFLMNKYLEGNASVTAGTEISGRIVFKAPENNPRALTISNTWTVPGQDNRTQMWKLR
ncbi:methyltransferase domain-containing protein [Colletotrichum lupini]|uniref:type I protein arginine methyltransferase n=3 Tax=Colletotrichum acutatum species complex TaxID=2707335 RepID=A0A9Q8SC29_9PEZI|nr:methyltransferase domain-containing protein [Colletotrichum lupini]XP_060307146.1 methyltransferase domain-containing protein [Colletotrichum costaricense]XP_060387204.1 methyltransferase domain-containing protein [Colletotrichum tamarilloi]KAI3552733.1 methyltransferase domain-containing protein [Colletotrichum filicis]KAK1508747.1 methyltransferase domain-containing protein [Colletotrichum tamarilloi]KAK1513966.1 methyltransferase domain-containing protein [Colletotrichum costaricense]KA